MRESIFNESSTVFTSKIRDRYTRVLIVTSVPAERDAVWRRLNGSDQFNVVVTGVGSASAAAKTATALAESQYDLVVNMGIAGGFVGRAEVGTLVVANEIVAADLGAQTPDGFISLDDLGFGTVRYSVEQHLKLKVMKALRSSELSVTEGPILTVSTVTGTAESADELIRRVPGATAEAMEGYGVAVAALSRDIPCLEIRAISNPVGSRDRTAWRIDDALKQLERASSALLGVLQ